METFAIVPANLKWIVFLVIPIGLLLAATFALVCVTALGSQRARFEVGPEGLRLRGDLYGRLIPAGALVSSELRVVDVRSEQTLRPVRRTVGTHLPGYRSGWFRLANGQKALVYVTDESHVAYIPTTLGYTVLLSAEHPDRLIARLREIAP